MMEIVSLIENPIFGGCGILLGFLVIGNSLAFTFNMQELKRGLIFGVFVLLIFHKSTMHYSFKFIQEIVDAGPIAAMFGVVICIIIVSQLVILLFFIVTLLERSSRTISVPYWGGIGYWAGEVGEPPTGHPLGEWSQPGIFLVGIILFVLTLTSVAIVVNSDSAADYAMHGFSILCNPIPIGLVITGITWAIREMYPFLHVGQS